MEGRVLGWWTKWSDDDRLVAEYQDLTSNFQIINQLNLGK